MGGVCEIFLDSLQCLNIYLNIELVDNMVNIFFYYAPIMALIFSISLVIRAAKEFLSI